LTGRHLGHPCIYCYVSAVFTSSSFGDLIIPGITLKKASQTKTESNVNVNHSFVSYTGIYDIF